jgi:hypothetical protein
LAGVTNVMLDIYVDRRARRIIYVSNELLFNDGEDASLRIRRTPGGPGHFGHIQRDAAEHLAFEVFDDLRAALVPPLCLPS